MERASIVGRRLDFDPRNPKSIPGRFRSRRDVFLRSFIETERRAINGAFRIADLGGTADYWKRVGFDWLDAQDIEIVCVNHVAREFGASSHPRISTVVGDACDLREFSDGDFHMAHSNSVVEHVGRWSDMRKFANEVRRVARHIYVQTPYFWFPIDPHFYKLPFYHWLPESLRLSFHRRVRLGHVAADSDVDRMMSRVQGTVLLDRRQFKALFPKANHRFETVMGLPKSMIAYR